MENEKIIEGEEILEENPDAETLAAPVEEEEIPNLNTTPVPTEEEKVDAGLESATTPETPTEPEPENNLEQPAEQAEPEKTFTQSQVNDMIGKTRVETRNKTFEYIFC